MATSVIGTSGNDAGTGSSTTPRLTMPSGINAGDVAVYAVHWNTSDTVSSFTGWTQVSGSPLTGNGTLYSACYYRVCDGTEGGDSVGPTMSGGCRWVVQCVVVRGATPGLDNVATLQRTLTSDTTTLTLAGITPVANNCLMIGLGGALTSANGAILDYTPGSGWTERADDCCAYASAPNRPAIIQTKQLTGQAGSAQGTSTATASGNITRQNTFMVTVAPSGGGVTVTPGAFTLASPTLETGDGVTMTAIPAVGGLPSHFALVGAPGVRTYTTGVPTGSRVDLAPAGFVFTAVDPYYVGPVGYSGDGVSVHFLVNDNWVDLGDRVALDGPGIVYSYGKPTRWDDLAPGTANLTLRNNDGAVTPDSPAATYPITRGTKLRITHRSGGVNTVVFQGRVDAATLDASNGLPGSTVTISASDQLAVLGRVKGVPIPEQRAKAHPGLCVWLPMDDPEGSRALRNVGHGRSAMNLTGPADVRAASIVPSRYGFGSVTVGGDPEGLTLDGMVEITRSDTVPSYGPVVRATYGQRSLLLRRIEFWFRTTDEPATGQTFVLFSATHPYSPVLPSIMVGYSAADPERRCRVWYDDGSGVEGNTSPPAVQFTTGGRMNSGVWRHVRLDIDTVGWTTTGVFLDGEPLGTVPAYNWVESEELFLGGQVKPRVAGGQWQVPNAAYAGLGVWSYSTDTAWTVYPDTWTPALLTSTDGAATRISDLLSMAGLPVEVSETEETTVGAQKTGGDTSLVASLSDVLRTTGGRLDLDPALGADGVIVVSSADDIGPTPAVTLDLALDIDVGVGGLVWQQDGDQIATRVTASAPLGSVTLADPDLEPTTEYSVDAQVQTVAATPTRLVELAGARLTMATGRRRLAAVTVDTGSSQTSGLAQAMLRPVPGSRVRVTSLPGSYFGRTWEDGIIEQVTVTLRRHGPVTTLVLSPADVPSAEGLFDDTERGRFAADGQTLYNPIAAADTTLTVATPAGKPTITVASDDFPIDLDVGGERIRVVSTLVPNGTFETDVSGWTAWFGSPVTIARSTAQHHTGAASALLTLTSTTSVSMGCSVATIPGETYTLSAWIYIPASGGVTSARIEPLFEASGPNVTTKGSWQKSTVTWVADDTYCWVSMSLDGSSGQTAYYDDVRLLYGSNSLDDAVLPGSTSPQTFYVARGIAPTIAVAHPDETPVRVWQESVFGI